MTHTEIEAQTALGTIRWYTDTQREHRQCISFFNEDDIILHIRKLGVKGLTWLLSMDKVYKKGYQDLLSEALRNKRFNLSHAMLIATNAERYKWTCERDIRGCEVVDFTIVKAIREGKFALKK